MDSNIFHFIDYLEKDKKYSKHTILAYQKDLDFFSTYIYNQFQESQITNVHYPMIRNWIVSLSDDKISNQSINRKIASLKAFYRFLQKNKTIQESPLLKHKALKTHKSLQIPFSEKELDHLLNNLTFPETIIGIRDKLIIDVFYTTGIRKSELIELKTKDVDVNNKTIKVLGKRNKERIIPILPKTIALIHIYNSEKANIEQVTNEYFFLTEKAKKLYNSLVYKIINSYLSEVSEKVKKSPHMLRHTYATHLLNNGADLNSVKELLGHSSLASTQVYTNSSLAELKNVYQNNHPRNNNDSKNKV